MYCPIIKDFCATTCRFYNKNATEGRRRCSIDEISLLGTDIIKAATILAEAIKEANKSELDKCVKTFVDGSSALSIIKEE